MSCYRYKSIEYEKGLLDNIVDATYVIHLEGSPRLDSVLKGLNEYKPSKTCYILFNKGYKKCKKPDLIEQLPRYDLIHAYLEAFRHANQAGYENILILEDDFIFSKRIKHKDVPKNLEYFFKEKKGEPFIYYLGCLPHLITPYDEYHYHNYSSSGTHACIYTPEVRKLIKKNHKNNTDDWDVYLVFNYSRYAYHEPLCYQTFPATDNRNTWPNPFGIPGLASTYIKFIEFLELDTKVEPGFSIFYFVSKMWVYISILILVILIVWILDNYL
jgi:hypothetical protein